MTTNQIKLYDQVKNEFAYENRETKWVITQVMWLARIAGGFDSEGKNIISEKKINELTK